MALVHYLALRAGVARATNLLHLAGAEPAAALYLAEWFGCRVTAVEALGAETAQAGALARERGLQDRVRFLRLDPARAEDARELPAAAFDVALSGTGLRWAAREGGLEGILRALRPGGRLALGGPVLQLHPEPGDDLPRDAGRWDLLTLEEYAAAVQRARLRLLHVEPCHALASSQFQPLRERILAGDRAPQDERAARDYDRTAHRFLGWGLLIAEKPR